MSIPKPLPMSSFDSISWKPIWLKPVKLASGSAKAWLEELSRETEAMGATEPAADKPLVKAELLETQSDSSDKIHYVYRVTSDVEVGGMEPFTARLLLSKEGNGWRVSKFVQEE
jgi:hypothetical protein